MNRRSRVPSALLVLERGGRLPARGPAGALSTTSVVVAQEPAESADELVERTAARLSELDGEGRGITFALLACGESANDSARAKLADVILWHLRGASARLVLTAKRRACMQLRRDLVSLADRAITTMGARGGSVSIWFGDSGRA